ncbi:MAG TPA: FAD-binding oxidoreductase [Ornithinibacter sp.]|nr:FAD-binding oxidoreductase [Ornithinibacter sp.]
MDDILVRSIGRSVWHGWGDPSEAHPLGPAGWAALEREIGVTRINPVRPVALADVRLPDQRLGHETLGALVAEVGAQHVHTDRWWRVHHAGGKGYPDLLRLRAGDGSAAPDAVVVPGDPSEVQALLRVCTEHRVAVIPYGGGTSVVGGVGRPDADLARFTGVVAVDLRRLDKAGAIDSVSLTATLGPGLRGPDVEQVLRPHGLTLGHVPQSHQEATLGGYVATRSAGQASTGYGRIDDNVLGVRVATPRGELVLGGRGPASAAGPRLLDVVVGSEGALGIITEVTMQVAPAPTTKRYGAWLFASFAEGCEALRYLAQRVGRGNAPEVCRLSDPVESRVNLAMAGRAGSAILRYGRRRHLREPTLLVLIWEGRDSRVLAARHRACTGALRAHGGRRVPRRVAQAWERGRFTGPYLRDELMDHSILVDTIETATSWRNLTDLHDTVAGVLRSALETDGVRALVMCHVSHIYATGASLYFTVIAPQAAEPMDQWRRFKGAANDAVLAGGGTITHHHGVGRDHRAALAEEIGDVGVRLLRAVKKELDPTGVLNPATLVPDLPDPSA